MKDLKTILSKNEIGELAERMYECVEIQCAIESGQFKSLEDVLEAVKARSVAIGNRLREAGAFDEVRSLIPAEFEEKLRQVNEYMFLVGLNASELTRQ